MIKETNIKKIVLAVVAIAFTALFITAKIQSDTIRQKELDSPVRYHFIIDGEEKATNLQKMYQQFINDDVVITMDKAHFILYDKAAQTTSYFLEGYIEPIT